MMTLAANIRAPWQVRLSQVELPDQIAAGEVLVRVEACGICGTDLHAAEWGAKDWQPFGHEVAGVIEALGPGIQHLQVGQSVVLETASYCGVCETCRNGQVERCNKAPQFWGRPAMGFSQRMMAPVNCVVPYIGLTPEVAALVEPAGVAYDMVKTAGIRLGDRVAIVGPGPIALMAIPLALRSGARRVVCIGRSSSMLRLDLAQRLGAEIVCCDEPISQRSDLARQFDHVLVTAPVSTLAAAVSLLDYGGEITYIGIGNGGTNGNGEVRFDADDFHFRKLQLRASFASPALYFPVVIELLKCGIIPGDMIISHRFPLDRISDAMELLHKRKSETLKVVITGQ